MYLPQFDEEEKQALTIAIQALEEIQQYREIGTVEETQKKMEELERWHTDRINENIKNPFAYTSTLICHNCDHKDEYIEELESEVAEYKTIGTIEEFKALKEKEELFDRNIKMFESIGLKIRQKTIDEFVERLKKHEQENWIDHQEYGITWSDIEKIAEEMRGAK